MRLYLLPVSTRRTLIYCQKFNQQTNVKSSYVDRITHKAAETWAKWEAAESGWQKRVTVYGNRALQGIPFEEWGLKTIPPLNAKRQAEEVKQDDKIEVVFPANVVNQQEVPAILKRLGTERQSLHKRRAWWSIVAMPFTAPIALIPVIPNLPFFYLIYRSWSHFKALSGSRHLVFLVDKNLLKVTPSKTLDRIYSGQGSPPRFVDTPDGSSAPPDPSESLLLDDKSHLTLSKTLQIPELAVEVERAVKQVRKAIQSHKDLAAEQQTMAASNKGADPHKETPQR